MVGINCWIASGEGDVFVEERTVDVCVRRLRKTLEPHGFDKFVETIRGVGYRFSANPS